MPVVYGFTQNGMLCVASCMPYCKRVDLSRSIMMMMMMIIIIKIIAIIVKLKCLCLW